MAATLEATPRAAAPAPPASSGNPWLSVPRNRYLALGGGVALLALIGWLVVFSGQRKESFAGRSLDQARAVAEGGNLPQAASEFQKII